MKYTELETIIKKYYSPRWGKKLSIKKTRRFVKKTQARLKQHRWIKFIRYLDKTIFPNNYVMDFTGNDYSCYAAKVLMHEGQDIMDDDIELLKSLGGYRKDLLIYVSCIAKVCYCYYEITEYDALSNKLMFSEEYKLDLTSNQGIRELLFLFQKMGYSLLDTTTAKKIVSGVTTECKDEPTVFDCCFEDVWAPDFENNVSD